MTKLTAILEKLEIAREKGKEAQERPFEIRPVKAEDIFEFKPTDTQDDCEYFLFIERITDFVAQYTEERVRPSLISRSSQTMARIFGRNRQRKTARIHRRMDRSTETQFRNQTCKGTVLGIKGSFLFFSKSPRAAVFRYEVSLA
jgi:hypothetical protein